MNKNNSLTFALTILISGTVVAGAVLITRTNYIGDFFNKQEVEFTDNRPNIQPITSDDHILGNPDADVIIIEYSDFECPFCREFHTTMRRIIDEFGDTGRVAWVYRQLPLEEVHLNARRVSLVSECIARKGNNNKFWKFTNQIFDNAPESLLKNNTDQIISNLGFDPEEINSCTEKQEVITPLEEDLADGEYFKEIDPEFGTPYNIIITKTGLTTNVSGSIPYALIKDIIEQHSFEF